MSSQSCTLAQTEFGVVHMTTMTIPTERGRFRTEETYTFNVSNSNHEGEDHEHNDPIDVDPRRRLGSPWHIRCDLR